MLGGHLDSVHDGPGINDDGSGVAGLLEIARAAAGGVDGGRIRFAFWAGGGVRAIRVPRLRGQPVGRGASAMAGYMNLDMLGSPNAVPLV